MIKLITPKINCNHFLVNDEKNPISTHIVVKNSHFCLNCSNISWLPILEPKLNFQSFCGDRW